MRCWWRRRLYVQLGGVLPGEPGEPAVLQGTQLGFARANEALIDRSTQLRTGLKVGDKLAVRSTVASRDEIYELTVAGITGSEQYSLQPTVFVGSQTWERIRPRSATATDLGQTVFNVAFVELAAPEQADEVARIHEQGRAGIMVTHDLRMCRYVDRVVRMTDGRIASELTSRAEIENFVAAAAH